MKERLVFLLLYGASKPAVSLYPLLTLIESYWARTVASLLGSGTMLPHFLGPTDQT